MNALERGTYYLNIKPRTSMEVKDYLKEKGYSDDEINDAVCQLAQYHYIDDASYAKMYFKYGYEKGRGDSRIKSELKRKGISDEIISDALYELCDEGEVPEQYEIAFSIAKDICKDVEWSSEDYKELKKIEARVGRRLKSRGFSNDLIYKVLRNLKS